MKLSLIVQTDAMDLSRAVEQFRSAAGVPAVVAGISDRSALVDAAVAGVCRRGESEPASLTDAWHIGSCLKSVTALLYACLVEDGRAAWDVPVSRLFPDLHAASGWDEPTVDDLLLCRGGVAANPAASDMAGLHADVRSLVDQRSAAAERVLADSPVGHGDFVYSNLGYALVGAAVDRLAGCSYEDALDRYVFEPLGVTSHGFGAPQRVFGHGGKLVLGPRSIGKGRAVPPTEVGSDNPPLLGPAGRLHLTVEDWGEVQRVFLNEGRPLVSPESIARLTRVPEAGTMGMGWASADSVGGWIAAQGSNTLWAAAAIFDRHRERCALVVANDGRSKVLAGTARLAVDMLELG